MDLESDGGPQRGQRSRLIEELTDEELELIATARVSAEYDHLNALLDDDSETSALSATVGMRASEPPS